MKQCIITDTFASEHHFKVDFAYAIMEANTTHFVCALILFVYTAQAILQILTLVVR